MKTTKKTTKLMTDTEIKKIAFQLLSEKLGELDTERFVASLLREPADYTNWQQQFFEDTPLETLSKEAMQMRKKKK